MEEELQDLMVLIVQVHLFLLLEAMAELNPLAVLVELQVLVAILMVLLDLHYKAVLVERTVDLMQLLEAAEAAEDTMVAAVAQVVMMDITEVQILAKDRNLAVAVLEVLVISFLLAQELQVHLQENLILIEDMLETLNKTLGFLLIQHTLILRPNLVDLLYLLGLQYH